MQILYATQFPRETIYSSKNRTTIRVDRGSTAATAKPLTFVGFVDLVQPIAAEAREYPPGAEDRQGVRARHIGHRLTVLRPSVFVLGGSCGRMQKAISDRRFGAGAVYAGSVSHSVLLHGSLGCQQRARKKVASKVEGRGYRATLSRITASSTLRKETVTVSAARRAAGTESLQIEGQTRLRTRLCGYNFLTSLPFVLSLSLSLSSVFVRPKALSRGKHAATRARALYSSLTPRGRDSARRSYSLCSMAMDDSNSAIRLE